MLNVFLIIFICIQIKYDNFDSFVEGKIYSLIIWGLNIFWVIFKRFYRFKSTKIFVSWNNYKNKHKALFKYYKNKLIKYEKYLVYSTILLLKELELLKL